MIAERLNAGFSTSPLLLLVTCDPPHHGTQKFHLRIRSSGCFIKHDYSHFWNQLDLQTTCLSQRALLSKPPEARLLRSHLWATEHGLQVRFLLNANLGYTIDNRVGGTGWAKDATLEALKAGYRHLDCAWMYGVRLSRIPVPLFAWSRD